MPLRKDIWKSLIVKAPVEKILEAGSIEQFSFQSLPEPGPFQFLADPFPLWRGDLLHVFAEFYDYRTRIGNIEVLTYDPALRLVDRRTVLAEPWHLSYPVVFEADGETWMLPEAHKSGKLTLYRSLRFPFEWQAAHVIALDQVVIDATPVRYQGRWWIFCTSARDEHAKVGELYAYWAPKLAGPWTAHCANPIRTSAQSARPGGRAFVLGERIILPVQDCELTYGHSIRTLSIEISPSTCRLDVGPGLTAPKSFAPHNEGLHTLSGAGNITLVDVKRTDFSLHGLAIDAVREGRKCWRSLSNW